ncbi:MAG: LysM peptidoglycan-binding domain-containing protein [Gemmatimonadales bacterium]|jgi:nucleoid-associated protein YgaU|nr:LysM peptidoglycan-binding domain-containing protein [Gemmatimonadales bacterium]
MAPDVNMPDFSDVEGGSSSSETKPAEEAVRTYEVQKGDSLWKIAKHAYGDGNKWKLIAEANKDVIPNPDLIKPGQVLTLPALPDAPTNP